MDHKTAQEFFEIREQLTQTIADRVDGTGHTRADWEGLAETLLMDYNITTANNADAATVPSAVLNLNDAAWATAAEGMLDQSRLSYMAGSVSRGRRDDHGIHIEYRAPNGNLRDCLIDPGHSWFEVLS